ncbi:hypothetical protein LTR29_013588 [Friedmanniomyces endolithicus]|nr:hypothetical protein LTR29_013588 [Friedmanniomyces endolithicus]
MPPFLETLVENIRPGRDLLDEDNRLELATRSVVEAVQARTAVQRSAARIRLAPMTAHLSPGDGFWVIDPTLSTTGTERDIPEAKTKARTAMSQLAAVRDDFQACVLSAERWAEDEKAKEREKDGQQSEQRGPSGKRPASPHPEGANKRPNRVQPPPSPLRQQGNKTESRMSPQQIQEWHDAIAVAFYDRTVMRSFPPPPSEPCTDPTCSNKSRTLKACRCNIRTAFEGRPNITNDRLQFKPDKFTRVPRDVREGIQQAVHEVFAAVDGMCS